MIKKSLKLLSILVMILLIGSAATPALAQPVMILDFLVFEPNGGGSVFLDELTNTIVGSGIPVTSVSGTGTPVNSGNILALTDAFLNFQTTIGGSDPGYITITTPTETFMSGSFVNDPVPTDSAFGSFHGFFGAFTDTKDVDTVVENYFDFGAAGIWSGIITLNYDITTGYVFSGNITNTNEFPPGAPIPGSLVLLGTGIITMLGIGLRRKA